MSQNPSHPADPASLLAPSVLVLDDERQIHSSLRLRLGGTCRVTCQADPRHALAALREGQYDLCFVDLHMPGMDGLDFIEAAKQVDPALGYVILTGYDSDENLRRAIPLQVLEFLVKPLPDKTGFEDLVPRWVDRTRRRRREIAADRSSGVLVRDLEIARLEREVEFTASAHARDALLQTAGLLTTTQTLLLNAEDALAALRSADPRLTAAVRTLAEARAQTELAAAVAEGYFASAYADRESSPALLGTGLQHAVRIAHRLAHAEPRQQQIDFHPPVHDAVLAGLAGMDLLLMLVPAIVQALALTAPGGTLQIRCHDLSRLDRAFEDRSLRDHLWINRREAAGSAPGVLLAMQSASPALDEETAKAWLLGQARPTLRLSGRGVLHGVQMARGLLGLAIAPPAENLSLVFCLRV